MKFFTLIFFLFFQSVCLGQELSAVSSRNDRVPSKAKVFIRSSDECLILSISNEIPVMADLTIYNSLGQKIYAGKILLSDMKEKVCLTQIQQGIYFYSISKNSVLLHVGKFFHWCE